MIPPGLATATASLAVTATVLYVNGALNVWFFLAQVPVGSGVASSPLMTQAHARWLLPMHPTGAAPGVLRMNLQASNMCTMRWW
jgi:hypothetical protein